MEIQYWNKDKIQQLTVEEQSKWFDVYNNGLETDRGFYLEQLSKTKTTKLQKDIKLEFKDYLNGLVQDENFEFYTILINDDNVIVSLCRLMKREQVYYVSGLETHRDYQHLGYAKQILVETIKHAFELGYDSIHSVVRKWNQPSIQTHISVGFKISEDKGDNLVLSFANINLIVREKIEEFLDSKVEYCTIISEKIDKDDIQLDYEIKANNITYIAKLHSSNDFTTTKIFTAMKHNRSTDPFKVKLPIYIESKRYGFAHKYHIHSRDYWLWIEEYIK